MIEKRQVQKLTERWQTTADNVIREYFQQLFLSYLYQEKGSDSLLFKGGTALRIIWQSPGFSEDLDFTGVNISIKGIEALMEGALDLPPKKWTQRRVGVSINTCSVRKVCY